MLEINDIITRLPRKPDSSHWHIRPLRAITKIVVHYDAVAVPTPNDDDGSEDTIGYSPIARYINQANYHIGKNWNETRGPIVRGFGLMYHYRVSADGRVWRTQPEELITWHAHVANYRGLAVCCDLGPGQSPTEAQLRGLTELLDHLCYHRPEIPAGRRDVWGHGELVAAGNHTPCPGGLMDWTRAYRDYRED